MKRDTWRIGSEYEHNSGKEKSARRGLGKRRLSAAADRRPSGDLLQASAILWEMQTGAESSKNLRYA